MSFGSKLIDMFSQGGIRGQEQQRQRMNIEQSDADIRKQQASDLHADVMERLHNQMLDEGWKPSFGGLVRQDSPTPERSLGNDADTAPVQSYGQNGAPDVQSPGVPLSSLGARQSAPATSGGYLRPAIPELTHTFKDPTTGIEHTYEAPGSLLERMTTQMAGEAPKRQVAVQQAGDVAAASSGGSERGRQDALNRARQQYGTTVPSFDPNGVVKTGADGRKYLPEELGPVVQGLTTAQEAPLKLQGAQLTAQQAQLADASRRLGSVSTPGAYKVLYDRIPKELQSSFDSPDQFDPIKTPTRARMVAMSPEEQQKTSLLLNMAPGDWAKSVDDVAPPTGKTADLNRRTKTLVNSALRRGDFAKADAAVKDAADQLGRTETAVRSAEATAPIKISVAGAETTARNNANMGGSAGDSGGLNPQMEGIAQQVANYQLNPTTALSRIPFVGRQALLNRVQQINPDFHQEYYNNFNKTETDATTGKIGTAANALNTMMGHLQVLNEAAGALKNGNIQLINQLANAVGVQVGQTPVTTYNTILHRLGPEVTKAYVAGGGSVGERGTNESDFDAKLGPDQIQQNIAVSAKLAESKIKALQDQYTRGTYGRGKQKLISEEAEATRQRLAGGGGAAVTVVDPNGGRHTFRTQADADAFKKAAGIQ